MQWCQGHNLSTLVAIDWTCPVTPPAACVFPSRNTDWQLPVVHPSSAGFLELWLVAVVTSGTWHLGKVMADFLHNLHSTEMEPNAFFLGYFEGFESQCAEFSECTEPFFATIRSISFRINPKIPKEHWVCEGRLSCTHGSVSWAALRFDKTLHEGKLSRKLRVVLRSIC